MIVVSFIAAAVLVGIDQLTKYLAVQYVKPAGSISVIDGFFQLTYVENRGAAFGMLQNQRWFFIGMTVVLILAACILLVKYRHHTWASYCCAALIISGGIGNLIDRIALGYVVDFLSFSIFPPVFNFADCCVTIGALCFVYHVLFAERKARSRQEAGEAASVSFQAGETGAPSEEKTAGGEEGGGK